MRYNNYVIYYQVKKISLIKFLNKRIQVGLIPNAKSLNYVLHIKNNKIYRMILHHFKLIKLNNITINSTTSSNTHNLYRPFISICFLSYRKIEKFYGNFIMEI